MNTKSTKMEELLKVAMKMWEEKTENNPTKNNNFMLEQAKSEIKKADKRNRVFDALKILSKYLDTEYNLILKDGKKYTMTELRKEMKVSQLSAQRYFKALKMANYIQLIDTEKYGQAFAINPRLYSVENVSPKIVEFFDKQSQKIILTQIADLLDNLSTLI